MNTDMFIILCVGVSGVFLVSMFSRATRQRRSYGPSQQAGRYGMQEMQPGYAMRPIARSSSFLSNIIWILALAVIAYVLLKMYHPNVLYPLHAFVPWL